MQMLSKKEKWCCWEKGFWQRTFLGGFLGNMHNSHNVVNCMQFKISMGRDVKRDGDEKWNLYFTSDSWTFTNFSHFSCYRMLLISKELYHPELYLILISLYLISKYLIILKRQSIWYLHIILKLLFHAFFALFYTLNWAPEWCKGELSCCHLINYVYINCVSFLFIFPFVCQ